SRCPTQHPRRRRTQAGGSRGAFSRPHSELLPRQRSRASHYFQQRSEINTKSLHAGLGVLKIIRFGRWFIGPRQPQWTAQIVWPRCRAGFQQPLFIDFVGFVGVDENVAVLVTGAGFCDADLLMPAVLAADEVRLYRKRQILMHAAVLPKN